MSPILSDLRIAARTAWRRKAVSGAVVAALGTGIGLASAVVIIAWSVLGRPLPYPQPDRLVVLREAAANGDEAPASYVNFSDWRERSATVASLAAVAGPSNRTITGGERPERAPVMFVSRDFFDVAGVAPYLGRPLGAEDQVPGGGAAAVVSYEFWRRALGAPESLAGQALVTRDLMNRVESYDVVGVMPPGFRLEGPAAVYLPLDRAVPWPAVRGNHVVNVVGRLEAGVSPAAARSELTAIQSAIHEQTGQETESVAVTVRSLHQAEVGAAASPLLLLLAAAGCLLLIAFVNAGGTLLARGVARSRELAVRAALGASRPRVAWQLVSESLVLGAAGGLAGAAAAYGLIAAFTRADPSVMPRLGEITARTLPVLAASAGMAVLGVALFGAGTAVLLTRRYATGALRSASAGATRRERLGWQGLLSLEVALALALLVGAGLMGRTVRSILTEDVGYSAEHVASAQVSLPASYGTMESYVAYHDDALRRLRALPGVEAAGLASALPIPGGNRIGSPIRRDDGTTTTFVAQYVVADAGLFDALGIGLVEGRTFNETDGPSSPHVTVINTSLAERLWPGQDPIGKRFNLGGMDPYRDHDLTVVGVVEEARPWNVAPGGNPTYYVAESQRPFFLSFTGLEIVVKGARPDLAGAVRETLGGVDPDVPVQVTTLEQRLGKATAQRRFILAGLGVFGGLALLLVAIGIWGVVSFLVARRRKELGIRTALGASPARVVRSMQRLALLPALVGVAAGAGLAAAGTGLIRSLLFGVQPVDAPAFLAAVAAVTLAAWLASYLPARRATRSDPAEVLREE